MENNQEREDLSKIRHYKGTVKDFKDYWDEMAGQDTNATGTPAYQDFNGVHPAGKARQSEHWKTSNIIESKRLSFKDAQITDTMDLSNALVLIGIKKVKLLYLILQKNKSLLERR